MNERECARRLGACLIYGCAGVMHATSSYADWEAIPDVKLEAETNDNPALNSVSAGVTGTQFIDTSSRLLADAAIRIRNAEQRGELMFEPRVRSDTYADDQAKDFGLESTDVFLRSSGVSRGQTVRLGYNADIAKERILGVEFLETLPDDPVVDDPTAIATTQVGVNEQRTRFGVTPYVDIAMNSRSTVVLDGHIVDVDYESDVIAGRTDFLDRGVGGEYRHALGNQRSTLGVRVFATGYEASANANTTDTRGIELMYARDVSEIWSWNISGGTQRSDFALTSGGRRIRGTDDSVIYGIGVEKHGERSSMRSELQRQMAPDALGFVAPRDELRVSWTRQMTPRVNGRMVLRAIDAEGVPTVIGSDRQYGRFELGLDWQIRPTWSFIAAYAYARSSAELEIAEPAESNAITLGVRYHGRSVRPGSLAPQ
jgi:hypothetical protein